MEYAALKFPDWGNYGAWWEKTPAFNATVNTCR